MPSPIGHGLAGIIVFDAFRGVARMTARTKTLVLCLIVSIFPDFDFLFGILEGEPNKYHHGMSHSLVMSFGVGLILAAIFSAHYRFWTVTCLLCCVYVSHLLLDLLSYDRSYPYGLQLMWPFSDAYIISPKTVFMEIRRENKNMEFIPSLLLNGHNYRAVLWEAVLLLPPLIALRTIVNRRAPNE